MELSWCRDPLPIEPAAPQLPSKSMPTENTAILAFPGGFTRHFMRLRIILCDAE